MLRVECRSCGAKLRGPDEAAGKTIKCPKCGSSVVLPQVMVQPRPVAADLPPADAFDLDDAGPGPLPARSDDGRKPCPSCGEMIAAGAVKCRFCGEDLLAKPKQVKKKKAKRKSDPADDDLSGVDMVICFLCPGIGCIAGVVYLIMGKGKGGKTLGFSIASWVFWIGVRVVIELVLNNK